jgi:O-antigen/teichoic acid export membrane protein
VFKFFHAAWIYTLLGLLSGILYREVTKHYEFDGDTQLSIVHTHLLALGTLMMLILMVLAKVFPPFGEGPLGTWSFWLYNAGVAVTAGMQTLHGILTVQGHEDVSAAISGTAGGGHILLTIAFALIFVNLYQAIEHLTNGEAAPGTTPETASTD